MRASLPMDLTVALAGLALAFFAGARMTPDGKAGGSAAAGNQPERTAAKGGAGPRSADGAKADGDAHSLSSLEKRLRRHSPGPDYSSHMDRLSAGGLREITGTLFKMMLESPESGAPAIRAIGDATRELYKREGEAALEWAASLPKEAGRDCVWEQMLFAAMEDSPTEARPWVERYMKENPNMKWGFFMDVAIRSATKQGVDGILELKKVYGDQMGDRPVAGGPLPADFDHKRLLGEFGGRSGMQLPLRLWAAGDPEGVWSALKEAKDGDGQMASFYSGSIFAGICQTRGEKVATEWMLSRLDELPADKRERAVYSLLGIHENRYQVVDTVMASLPREADRVTLAQSLVSPFAGDAPLDILRKLGSSSLQVEALVGSAKKFSRAGSDPANPMAKSVNEYYNRVVGELDLPPADRERVLETLRTPQDVFPKQ